MIAKGKELVESSKADPGIFQLLQGLAMQFEGEHPELAGQLYDLIAASYSEHADPDVSKVAKQSVENARKRLGLIGKPFEVTGTLLDGKPFDWKKYEGKMVLVDFWATWCQPCLEEMSNISANYKEFHDRGFEVVGVNLDDGIKEVEEFFEANRPLPWTTVVGPDDDHRAFDHPMAVKCGVDAIPFVVLVGRDGKVAGIHVRGPRLGIALKEMLAGTEKPAAAEASEKTKASAP